jgi:DNA helicase-2/ATP-dependent DNA helicase PcrA
MTRAQYGESTVAMPSRYLQEIPGDLVEWKQSPGMATSRNGMRPRALNARPENGGRWDSPRRTFAEESGKELPRKTEWANRVTGTVRDNGDLELAVGDRIRHSDFGDGRVNDVTGIGPKRIAHVQFETAGAKKLLIKVAPIEKIEE